MSHKRVLLQRNLIYFLATLGPGQSSPRFVLCSDIINLISSIIRYIKISELHALCLKCKLLIQGNCFEEFTNLDVGHGRQRLLTVGVLGGEGQEGGHPQRDPGGDSLRLDPEADPGHHHDQTGRDVRVEHEVAKKNPVQISETFVL